MMVKYRRVRATYPDPDYLKDYWIEADGQLVGYVEADRPSRQGGTTARWKAYRLDGTRLCPIRGTFRALKLEVGWALAKP